jgi:hypothetical protein
MIDNLSTLKDDMIAFIEGHGMRRFHGFASEDQVQSIMWHSPDHSDGWKDFVELAKHSGAPFLTMHASALAREDLDELVEHLGEPRFGGGDDVEDARWLRQYVGKVGFIQLGWAYQGSMFLYEASTEWYAQYQHLLEFSEEIGGFALGEAGPDDEPS